MRPPEIVLIVLSIAIIALAGFGPLFGARDRHDVIRHECEMFYEPSGPGAVAHCMAAMIESAAR